MFWKRRKDFSYICACCGEKQSGSPSFAVQVPPFLEGIPGDEFDARVEYDDDLCIVRAGTGQEDDLFAIRVMLEIPIHGVATPFSWGVWVTQSRENFHRYIEGVGTDQRGLGSFGWMPMVLSYYQGDHAGLPVRNLACDVNFQEINMRPKISLHEADHPLYRDQRDGISWDRAVEIAQWQMERSHRVQ